MRTHHTVALFVIVVTLFGGLSGCRGQEISAGADSSDPQTRWLEGEPCAPPCWENIQIGVTHSAEANEILKTVPGIASSTLQATEVPDVDLGVILWKFSDAAPYWEGKVSYSLKEDIVDSISLYMPNLCLHEIIDAYGEPDYLLSPGFYEVGGVVNLIWESHGFTYEVETHSPGVPITANVCGGRVIEFSVGTPYQKIPSIYLSDGLDPDVIPWKGYGSYGNK